MPDALLIPPARHPITGRFRPPGSKSMTNRAVIIAAAANGASRLSGVLESEDTHVMAAGLQALGIPLEVDWASESMTIEGCGGQLPVGSAEIDCRASGTTMRFLTALCGLGTGPYRLDGTRECDRGRLVTCSMPSLSSHSMPQPRALAAAHPWWSRVVLHKVLRRQSCRFAATSPASLPVAWR